MAVLMGPRCGFCGTDIGMRVPDELASRVTKEQAALRLDLFFSVHLMRHVDDFGLTAQCSRRLTSGPYAWIHRQIEV